MIRSPITFGGNDTSMENRFFDNTNDSSKFDFVYEMTYDIQNSLDRKREELQAKEIQLVEWNRKHSQLVKNSDPARDIFYADSLNENKKERQNIERIVNDLNYEVSELRKEVESLTLKHERLNQLMIWIAKYEAEQAVRDIMEEAPEETEEETVSSDSETDETGKENNESSDSENDENNISENDSSDNDNSTMDGQSSENDEMIKNEQLTEFERKEVIDSLKIDLVKIQLLEHIAFNDPQRWSIELKFLREQIDGLLKKLS